MCSTKLTGKQTGEKEILQLVATNPLINELKVSFFVISRLYVGHLKYEYEFCGNGKVSICDAARHFISHVLGPLRDQVSPICFTLDDLSHSSGFDNQGHGVFDLFSAKNTLVFKSRSLFNYLLQDGLFGGSLLRLINMFLSSLLLN